MEASVEGERCDMPIYEYRCDACGHELEVLQKLSDEPLKDCPACDAAALRRLVSAPSFRLKGDGWYETDFKSDKETKRNLVDRAESKNDAGAKTKDDAKAAKKDTSAKPKDGKSTESGAKKDTGATAK